MFRTGRAFPPEFNAKVVIDRLADAVTQAKLPADMASN
jgi:hypothetical protein